jgi:hypothetical protein
VRTDKAIEKRKRGWTDLAIDVEDYGGGRKEN